MINNYQLKDYKDDNETLYFLFYYLKKMSFSRMPRVLGLMVLAFVAPNKTSILRDELGRCGRELIGFSDRKSVV